MIEAQHFTAAAGLVEGDTIDAIDVRSVTLPLAAPVRNGTKTITSREYAIVRVQAASGVVGIACAFTRGTPIVQVVRDWLAPRAIGLSPFEIPAIWQELYSSGEIFFGRSGVFPRAVSLIDIALWDLQGKLLGHSVAELLGVARPAVPILMALGYYHEGEELTILREEYEGLVERGFRQFKMMAGGASLERDLRRAQRFSVCYPRMPRSRST